MTVPADLVAAARNAVSRGACPDLSTYVSDALMAHVARERTLATLEDLYGGPPPADELDEARRTLRFAPPAAAAR